jgi:hypothetical protein
VEQNLQEFEEFRTQIFAPEEFYALDLWLSEDDISVPSEIILASNTTLSSPALFSNSLINANLQVNLNEIDLYPDFDLVQQDIFNAQNATASKKVSFRDKVRFSL